MDLAFYTNFSNSLVSQEAQLNKLQTQISTGLAVQTPDQNPAAFQSASSGNDQIAALANENTTGASIQVQLGSVNDSYQSVSNLFNNVQSVLESALNGTTSAQNLNALASQIQSASQQLIAIGNTTAPNGTYLFGGSRGTIAPFQANGSGVIAYLGDSGQSQASITPDSVASTIANGNAFMTALSGDGTASVTASATNTGTGQLISNGPVNATAASAFQAGSTPISLSFAASGTGSGTVYTATQGGTTIATGTLTPDAAETSLQLAGVSYQITGAPAAGDSFTLTPSRPQSAFALLSTIHSALANAGTTKAEVAQTNQILDQSLAALNQYQQSVVTAQAQNGVTLQAIANAATSNTNQSTALQTGVQNAVGVNTPVAIASLDQTLTALQAAMKTFGTVQNLSLFNYL
ncbi:MAG: flagellar hook-associated protein FlgL [Acidocella sp.]|nr:flagellar hook-associated protein FlgL [Acidocella sp.]